MDWWQILEIASDCIAIALVLRLLSLRLHTVYRVFCLLLIVEVALSLIALWIYFAHPSGVNYGVVWLSFLPIGWILYLASAYTLLSALLTHLPGILRFSRRVLHVSFLIAALIGVATARPEFLAHEQTVGTTSLLSSMIAAGLVGERIFAMVAALVLIATLAFILWFPVQMPRNLAIFSVGFIVYFAVRTTLLVVYSFWPGLNLNILNAGLLSDGTVCLLFLLVFTNQAGEEAPARMGHSWNAAEQQRLIGQLEAMNAALLRAARRDTQPSKVM